MIKMRFVRLLIIPLVWLYLVGCSQNESSKPNPANDYDVNKAKWEDMKNSISAYRIQERYSWMTHWQEVTLEIVADSSLVISCSLREGEWGSPETIVESDCLASSLYHKVVEDYFAELEKFITSGELTQYEFDPKSGVPTMAFGKKPSQTFCAYCLTPGFTIKFEVLQ